MADAEINESNTELRNQAEVAESTQDGRSPAAPDVPIVARVIRRYRARVFQAYMIGAVAGFAILFILASRKAYFKFDLNIAHWLQGKHTFWLDVLMQSVSELGFNPLATIFVIVTLLFLFLVGLKWEAVMMMITAAGVGILDAGVKPIVRRSRPTNELVDIFTSIGGYSFPSGHVLMFTVYLGFLMFLVYTLMPRSVPRSLGLSVMALLVMLVGASRVYLGHHWPSDVLGAYLLGSLWLVLTIWLYRKGKKRFFVRQPLAPEKPAQS